MPISIPGIPSVHFNQAETGVPDLGAAIRSGFDTYYKPKQMAEDLLKSKLANAINKPYAENADEWFRSQLGKEGAMAGLYGAQTGLYGAQTQKLLQDMAATQAFNKLMGNAQNTSLTPGDLVPNPAQTTGTPSIPNVDSSYKEVADENTGGSSNYDDRLRSAVNQSAADITLLSPGNAAMYALDKLYDTYPAMRSQFESRGIKKTQTVKTDPKTGVSSVVTTYPSGRTELSTLNATNTATVANTAAAKTKALNVVNGVQNAIPLIDQMIKDTEKGIVPGQLIGHLFSRNKQASYKQHLNESAETLANALGFPATNEGFKNAAAVVGRAPGETDAGYAARLKQFKKELITRRQNAQQTLKTGTSLAPLNNSAEQSPSILTYNPVTGRLE